MSEPETEPVTLDTLLAMLGSDPHRYQPFIYLYRAVSPYPSTYAGASVGPVEVEPGADETAIWRAVAARLGAPGAVVARVRTRGPDVVSTSCRLDLTPDLMRVWGPAATAPAAPVGVMAAMPQPLQGVDAMSLILQSMQSQQQLLTTLLTKSLEPRSDPAVAILQAEVTRLSSALSAAQAAPAQRDRSEREELIALGKDLAAASGGTGAALFQAFIPVADRLAGAVEKIADARARIEVMQAERGADLEQTRAEIELAREAGKAGLSLEPAEERTQ